MVGWGALWLRRASRHGRSAAAASGAHDRRVVPVGWVGYPFPVQSNYSLEVERRKPRRLPQLDRLDLARVLHLHRPPTRPPAPPVAVRSRRALGALRRLRLADPSNLLVVEPHELGGALDLRWWLRRGGGEVGRRRLGRGQTRGGDESCTWLRRSRGEPSGHPSSGGAPSPHGEGEGRNGGDAARYLVRQRLLRARRQGRPRLEDVLRWERRATWGWVAVRW